MTERKETPTHGDALDALVAENRRLRQALETVEWMGKHPSGDVTCPYCGARAYDVGDGPPRTHAEGCLIDAALGEEPPLKDDE